MSKIQEQLINRISIMSDADAGFILRHNKHTTPTHTPMKIKKQHF